MHDRDRGAGLGEAVARFQPQQSAADHHGARCSARSHKHGRDVISRAEREHTRKVDAGQRKPDGFRTRGEHKRVEGERRPELETDGPLPGIDADGFLPTHESDAPLVPPTARLEFEIGFVRVAGEQRREQHAVVRE